MAAGKSFAVTISASDKASATLTALNKRLQNINATVAKTREPFDRLASSFGKFTRLTGLNTIAGGLGRIARAGFGAFQSVIRIIEPLAAITGAASIAGMVRLATAWADFGTALGNAAYRAGLSASQLQALQGAARLAGVSGEAAASAMTTLKDNMTDAVVGKAPQVQSMVQALGLSLADLAKQAPTEQLRTLADRIAGLHDPTLQARAATTLFGAAGEQLLPFLKQGAAGIDEYAAKAERYGVMNQAGVEAANRLREAQTGLTLAVEGLGNSIAEKLEPILTPVLTHMADWIAANRDWIATGIGSAVQQFTDYIRSIDWNKVGNDIKGIYDAVKSVADAFGGWKAAGLDILRFMVLVWSAPLLATVAKIGLAIGSIPKKAAAAAAEANAELGKIKPAGGGLAGKLLGMLGTGYAAHEALSAVDPDDKTGSWIDRNIPGASWLDNQASRLGIGRSYAQQQEVDNAQGLGEYPGDRRHFAGPPPAAANSNLAGRGHDSNAERRDTNLPSGPNTRGAFKPAAYVPAGPSAGGPQWGKDLVQLQSYGWTKEQAAGILGNLDQESGGKENATGDGGAAYGLGQWHADRQAKFAEQFGHDIKQSTHAEQVAFVNWELHNTEASAGNHLAQATDARSAAAAIRRYYERPANKTGQEDAWRGDRADRILAANAGPPAPSGPPVALAAGAGTAANPGGGDPLTGSVGVNVRFDNAPQGTQTTTVASGNALGPLKVERSNVGYGQAVAA